MHITLYKHTLALSYYTIILCECKVFCVKNIREKMEMGTKSSNLTPYFFAINCVKLHFNAYMVATNVVFVTKKRGDTPFCF